MRYIFIAIILLCGCSSPENNNKKSYREIVYKAQGVKSLDACEDFLFGKDIFERDPFRPDLVWNKLHSDIFYVHPSDLRLDAEIRWAKECAKRKL